MLLFLICICCPFVVSPDPRQYLWLCQQGFERIHDERYHLKALAHEAVRPADLLSCTAVCFVGMNSTRMNCQLSGLSVGISIVCLCHYCVVCKKLADKGKGCQFFRFMPIFWRFLKSRCALKMPAFKRLLIMSFSGCINTRCKASLHCKPGLSGPYSTKIFTVPKSRAH